MIPFKLNVSLLSSLAELKLLSAWDCERVVEFLTLNYIAQIIVV